MEIVLKTKNQREIIDITEYIQKAVTEKKIKEGKIEIIPTTNIVEVKGQKYITGVVLDKPYKGKKEFAVDALFIEIGHIALSDLAHKVGVSLNKKGEIMIDRDAQTNVPGFYAAGDVVDTRFKQAITGVAEGVLAVYSAYTFLNDEEE